MIPFKKTYLIKLDKLEHFENDSGIIVINENKENLLSWKGTVVEYGAAWTEEEKKDLVPIGTRIAMTYGKDTGDKGGVKLVIRDDVYMIRDANEIIGVLEDE